MTFAPTQSGMIGATVTATMSEAKEAQAQFAISGTGQTEAAQLAVSPPVISFEATSIGGQRSETATFRNDGGAPLTIEKVELPAAPFSAEGVPKAGATIAAGGSLTVTVAFKPTSAGTFESAIGLETTGGNGQIGLSGSAGAPGTLAISGETLEYGSVLLGATSTKSFTIENTGGTAVPITKSKPPLGGAFAATTALPEGTTIQAGESVVEQVRFAPTELGPASGEWLINGEDTSGLHKVLFTGLGTKPSPETPETPPEEPGKSGTPTSQSPAPNAQASQPGSNAPAQGISPAREAAAPRSPDVALVRRVLTATRRGTVDVELSCPAPERSCFGTLELDLRIASRVAGRSGVHTAMLTLAAGAFTLAGGRAGTVALRLTARARVLLAHAHVLKALATVSARDPAGARHTAHAEITLRLPGAARRASG